MAYGKTDVDPEYYGTGNSDDDDDDTKLDSNIDATDSLVAV